ncbi:MAG: hypothetical protein DRG11_05420 [Epsilonproteobacteria bacterium]|nr:MAG: hypothetical protein DRG11_05420 [Campylobacterota bacterium]
MLKKIIFAAFLFMVSVFLVLSSQNNKINEQGAELINQSFEESIALYATVRVLNGVISVAQGTELSPPGATITIGEILDPINDLVERFSLLVLISVASLGIQKILLNMINTDMFFYVFVFSLVMTNITFLLQRQFYYGYIFKTTAIIVFLNFSIPLMSISNNIVYDHFVKQTYDIQTLSKQIQTNADNLKQTTTKKPELKDERSLLEKVTDKIKDTISLQFYKDKLEDYKKFAKDTTGYIIDLFIVFMFKTIIFPIIFLFFLYQVIVLRIDRYNGFKDRYSDTIFR